MAYNRNTTYGLPALCGSCYDWSTTNSDKVCIYPDQVTFSGVLNKTMREKPHYTIDKNGFVTKHVTESVSGIYEVT
jgi:hypothetical protein